MRVWIGFVVAVALIVSPVSVVADSGQEAATPAQNRLPPQLMLRASYLLYLDADAADVPDIDTLSERSIEHYESLEHHNHFTADGRGGRRGGGTRTPAAKAGIAVGSILAAGLVGFGIAAAVILPLDFSSDSSY